jgi:hypothetical protein
VTPGWPISNQATPTTLTKGCSASVPLASSVGVDHDAVCRPYRLRVGFHRRVEPSISVTINVTTPDGGTPTGHPRRIS